MVHYADAAQWYRSPILEQKEIAEQTFRVRLECPKIASAALPGQFVMLRIAGLTDPLIGRALAIYDRFPSENGDWIGVDLVYVAKGKFTTCLSKLCEGQSLEIWGPLGNSFSTEEVDHLILVAGGVGETPMLSLGLEALGSAKFGKVGPDGKERPSGYASKVSLCYGARSANLLACVDDFTKAGLDVRLSTDDGTAGRKQRVTETLIEVLAESKGSCRIACCGPEPMMHAVALIAGEKGVPCEVSLETPMACGIGICFTCVAKVCEGESWDYKRTCVEGPIFDASTLVW